MRKIIVLDSYDSFTYNLIYCIDKIEKNMPDVVRNDKIKLEELENYEIIIISPGPGLPSEAGIIKKVIERYAETKKILGVCLGHQAIGEVFGAKLKNLDRVYHGVQTSMKIIQPNEELFQDIPIHFDAGRYHSWVIDKNTLPDCLETTCIDSDGEIMGINHKSLNIKGVQFHPESILTPQGEKIMANYLK